MRLRVDAHAVLWFLAGDARLSDAARSVLEDRANDAYVSMATLWEIAIKVSINKLALGRPFPDLIEALSGNDSRVMAITTSHLQQVLALPYPVNHRDPFDRLMVSQAMVEDLTLMSRDAAFDDYSVPRLW